MSERNLTVAEHATEHSHEEVYDLLMNARQTSWVELRMRDGRCVQGAIIFNEFKGTGRLINVQDEISFDFTSEQILDVKIKP